MRLCNCELWVVCARHRRWTGWLSAEDVEVDVDGEMLAPVPGS